MPKIQQPKTLDGYLAEERRLEENSKIHWDVEYKLFFDLSSLYEQLTLIVRIKDIKLQPCCDLFLSTHSQMLSVVSLLLKRQVNEAQSMTRRAIEVTATAYRLFKRPVLINIYMSAYSGLKDLDDPKQWIPSREYQMAFKTTESFREPADFWKPLQIDYAMFSAVSTHAGIGAIISHQVRGDKSKLKRILPYFEYDNRLISSAWYQLIGIYWQLLRVFLCILRSSAAQPDMIGPFEEQLMKLQGKASDAINSRAPWIKKTAMSRSSHKAKPEAGNSKNHK